MPDGTPPPDPGRLEPFSDQVDALDAIVEKLMETGCTFPNEIVAGVGGKQIHLLDTSGEFGGIAEYFGR
jgi:hypothetical protein